MIHYNYSICNSHQAFADSYLTYGEEIVVAVYLLREIAYFMVFYFVGYTHVSENAMNFQIIKTNRNLATKKVK